jgi:sulfonate transport system substrate-binding protein
VKVRLRNGILVLALLSLAACGQDEPAAKNVPGPVSADDLAKVVLKVGDQKGGSKTLLTAAGLAKTPYRIEWATFTSGPPLLEAASAAGIDIGGVGNTPPIFAAAAQARISIVSSAKGNVESDVLLVPADSTARTVADLRGKNIAVAKGSSAHGQVLLNLKKSGLSTKDVKLNFLQPSDAYAAFTQKQVDAWAIWDPYTSQALLETGARVLVDGQGTAKATERGPDLPVALDDQVTQSEQELSDAFTADKVLPGKVDFASFVDKRYAADLDLARSSQ